jgi:CHAT domain-containing protein
MYYRDILAIICTLFLSMGIPAQTAGLRQYVQWIKQANTLYDAEDPTAATDSTALSLFLKVSDAASGTADEHLAIESLIKAGNIHQGYQRFQDANALYHRALALNYRQPDKAPAQYEAYLYLGSSMYFNNILDSATWYFELASDIVSAYPGRDRLPERDRLYNSLGAIYFEGANYRQAGNYFRKALDFSNAASTDYTEMYDGIQSNIASCLMKLNRYDSALAILQALKPSVYQENLIRQNTAHCLFELGRKQEALAIYEKIPLDEGYSSVVALTNMGRIHMDNRDWHKAEAIFDSAIARNKRYSKSVRNKEEALSYLYRAKLAGLQGLTDEAISWSNEALRELYYDFTPRNHSDLPTESSATVSPVTAFQVLTTKAAFLVQKFKASQQHTQLAAAVRTYRKAIETAAFIRRNFDNDEATLFFNQYNRLVFQEALDAAYTLYGYEPRAADDFLYILENYKGNALLQQMERLSIRSDIRLPDSLMQQEKKLRQLIALYTTRLSQTSEEQQEKQLQKRLIDLEVELSRLQKSLTENTRYSANPYRAFTPAMTAADILPALDGSEAVLSYFLGDGYTYCLAISSKAVSISKLPLGQVFTQAFDQFIRAVYEPQGGLRYQGQVPAAQLYQLLIAPALPQVDQARKWIIIPDGLLYLLPFEALVTNPRKKDYLLQHKTISYHYAMSLLMNQRQPGEQSSATRPCLAMAPFVQPDETTRRFGISALPGSGEETKDNSGKVYVGASASRQAFLAELPHYEILHLATHASTGGDSSRNWIQFYPQAADLHNGRMSIHEIYNLDLQRTRLVILSACETAGGASAGGEGLISLSRAFLYAGARGIISTLWKTEDQVTAFIMKRFRSYQDSGWPPEESLAQAKRDLLMDRQIDPHLQSPAYWANFIYTGQVQAATQRRVYGWLIAFFIVAAGGSWILSRRYRKTAARNSDSRYAKTT